MIQFSSNKKIKGDLSVPAAFKEAACVQAPPLVFRTQKIPKEFFEYVPKP